jgi:hypothetical protein
MAFFWNRVTINLMTIIYPSFSQEEEGVSEHGLDIFYPPLSQRGFCRILPESEQLFPQNPDAVISLQIMLQKSHQYLK